MSGALILFYHSVSPNADARIDPSIVVSPANFERQLDWLSSRMHVIPLADLVDSIRDAHPLPPRSVVITFDDGYRDNLTTVLPALRRFNLPAAFFLATGSIGAGRAKWEDRLSFALRNTPRSSIAVDGLGDFPLLTPAERAGAFNHIVAILSRLNPADRAPLAAAVEAQAALAPDRYPADVMLTWDEARALAADPLVTIGAHTIHHERLSQLDDAAVHAEIDGSRAAIEAGLSREVRFFAYPYGTPADFDTRAVDALRSSGFTCALTTIYARTGASSDPLRLPRVIGADTAGLRFSLGTVLRASPAGPWMRGATSRLKGSA